MVEHEWQEGYKGEFTIFDYIWFRNGQWVYTSIQVYHSTLRKWSRTQKQGLRERDGRRSVLGFLLVGLVAPLAVQQLHLNLLLWLHSTDSPYYY